MDMYGNYKSPFGYENGNNGGVDSYGVDHSGFSTQDELQYQTLRLSRENELANDMTRQGIAQSDYPQYGTNFWGNNLSNATNYDISKLSPTVQNALNLARNLLVHTQQPQEQENNITQTFSITQPQNYLQQSNSVGNPFNFMNNQKALFNVVQGYNYLSPLRINDKYKHSVLSCLGAQGGIHSTIAVAGAGMAKEIYDIAKKSVSPQKYGGFSGIISDSLHDLQADAKGLLEGYINPTGNCYDMMQNSYPINIK